MNCPKCSASLKHETYEGVQIERCTTCKGTWLDEGELVIIVNTQEEKFAPRVIEEAINLAFAGVPADEQRSVERCPKCSKAMLAVNYSYNSGVIIDRCPDSHGVWLDGEELERVQAHREHWSKETQETMGEWVALVRSVEQSSKNAVDETRRKEMRPTKYVVNSLLRKLLGL